MEKNDFGVTLTRLLKERDMTISQLAKKVGVSPTTANEWCGPQGRFPSKPEVLKKIAQAFEMPLHDLLFGEPYPMSVLGQVLEKTEVHTGLYEISIKRVNPKGKKI